MERNRIKLHFVFEQEIGCDNECLPIDLDEQVLAKESDGCQALGFAISIEALP